MVARLLPLALAATAALLPASLPLFQLRVEVPPRARITRHVVLVVDRSGSMHGDPLRGALQAVARFLEEPTDELQVALVAFADASARWPGRPEPGGARPVPPGWAAFPSEPALREASAWLAGWPARGGTNVVPALQEALREPRPELSIVLVSDGRFSLDQATALPAVVAEAQAARLRAGHGEAVLTCYGLGDRAPALAALADVGGGGYFRDAPEPPPGLELDDALGPTPVQGSTR